MSFRGSLASRGSRRSFLDRVWRFPSESPLPKPHQPRTRTIPISAAGQSSGTMINPAYLVASISLWTLASVVRTLGPITTRVCSQATARLSVCQVSSSKSKDCNRGYPARSGRSLVRWSHLASIVSGWSCPTLASCCARNGQTSKLLSARRFRSSVVATTGLD